MKKREEKDQKDIRGGKKRQVHQEERQKHKVAKRGTNAHVSQVNLQGDSSQEQVCWSAPVVGYLLVSSGGPVGGS